MAQLDDFSVCRGFDPAKLFNRAGIVYIDSIEEDQLLQSLQNPVLGMLAGAVFTALVQSSSAAIGLAAVMAISVCHGAFSSGNRLYSLLTT